MSLKSTVKGEQEQVFEAEPISRPLESRAKNCTGYPAKFYKRGVSLLLKLFVVVANLLSLLQEGRELLVVQIEPAHAFSVLSKEKISDLRVDCPNWLTHLTGRTTY